MDSWRALASGVYFILSRTREAAELLAEPVRPTIRALQGSAIHLAVVLVTGCALPVGGLAHACWAPALTLQYAASCDTM